MKRMAIFFAASCLILTSCSFKHARMDAADLPLAPADYEVLGWVTETACADYILGIFRTPQDGPKNVMGFLSPGSIIGGAIPDQDSADAMYKAMLRYPDATHLLAPRFRIEAKGVVFAGVVIFGERCSEVRVRAVSVKNGPLGGGGARGPVRSAKPSPAPETPKEVVPEKPEPEQPKRDHSDWR